MIIAFEGGEGSGKGTQIKLLQGVLEREGHDVLNIVEPGGTPVGQAIRNILLNRQDLDLLGITEAFLFSASRAQQVKQVTRPALEEGKIILSDRSFYSTYAYQGYGRGQNLTILENLTEIAVGQTKPDLVILLDLPPKVGLGRKKDQNEINRLDAESVEFHTKVREGYLEMARKNLDVWKIVDASSSIENIHNDIVSIVLEVLDKQKSK